jgi:hypothetical protein
MHHGDVVLARLRRGRDAEEDVDQARELVAVLARPPDERDEVGLVAAHVRGGELVEEAVDVSHRR